MRKITFQHKTLAGFTLTIIGIFIGVYIAYWRIEEFQRDGAAVDNTQEILKFTNQVVYNIVEAESNVRGYVATGQPFYLDKYNDALSRINPSVDRVTFLLNNYPTQQPVADSLSEHVQQKLYALNKVLWVANLEGMQKARLVLAEDKTLDKLEQLIEKIRTAQSQLLIKRRTESEVDSANTKKLFYVGSAFIVLLISILFSFIRKSFNRQKEVEASLLQNNLQMELVSKENSQKNLLLSGTMALERSMRGQISIESLCDNILKNICEFTTARIGSIYIYDEKLQLLQQKAKHCHESSLSAISLGEGLIGQAAADEKRIIINKEESSFLTLTGGFTSISPQAILIEPIIFNGQLIGVLELGFLSDPDMLFIERATDSIGIAIHSALSRMRIEELYSAASMQAQQLEQQHEELLSTNDELLSKTSLLQVSEEELRVQQEELSQTNAELIAKAHLLEERNIVVDQAKEAITQKMVELEQANNYKSEFLANMSHELRTPLNSVLILAKILKENKKRHLDEEETKFAEVIHKAGNDLLELINDILDLAKVESGQVDLDICNVAISNLSSELEMLFAEIARSKSIKFDVVTDPLLPKTFNSDERRIQQILKNLLSNAFKFTPENGSVSLKIGSLIQDGETYISFEVIDTGIGIPEDKFQTIFEAFKQADGSTTRTYGGTGLGLSISRELANVLQGELTVSSKVAVGSSFALILPLNREIDENPRNIEIPSLAITNTNSKRTVLIIEDDEDFADVIRTICSNNGLEATIAIDGEEGIRLANQLKPEAILLAINLPVIDGWAVLKRLKSNPETVDIPVHLLSARDESSIKIRTEGAMGLLMKPIKNLEIEKALETLIQLKNEGLRNVLLIEDHEVQSNVLKDQLKESKFNVTQAFAGAQALEYLNMNSNYDCIILDINLPDMSGLDLLDEIRTLKKFENVPIVINTAMELDRERLKRINRHTNSMVFKNSHSNNRLVEEVRFFIDNIKPTVEENPESFTESVDTFSSPDFLAPATLLLVDDDMRNIFALTSAFQETPLKFIIAENGQEALEKLESNPEIQLVLMDIMMPVMNGYEAITEIRKNPDYDNLPIIALTAKAMKDDRQKCIELGANEYISKPLDVDKLLTVITNLLIQEFSLESY